MVTDFQERLRQLREAKDRETQEERRQTLTASSERHAELENRFDRLEQVEKIIEQFSDNFMAVVPAFTRTKSFFEGMYKVETHSDDLTLGNDGHVTKHFSRITFLLDTHGASGQIVARCKKTVRNRDLESTSFAIDASADGLESFRRFSDEQFIDFANLYFSTPRTTTAR